MAGFAGIYNNSSSKPWTQDSEYDPNRYQYGGYAGGAQNQAANYNASESAVQGRAAPTIAGTQLNQGASDQSRQFQMGSLAGLQSEANGSAPSAAETLGRQGIDRSLAAQTSAAGTVRGGPGAQASAFRTAAQTGAQTRADMNQSVQANRATEIMGANSALANAATAQRGQDLGAATTDAQLGQQAQATNAGNQLQQTALNDQRASQYETLGNQVNEDQLKAGLTQQQIASGVRQNGDQLNTQTNQANVNTNKSVFQGLLGVGQGIAGGVANILSDPNSKEPLVMGSLANLGLGGEQSGVGGGVDLGSGMTHDSLLAAGTGLGSPQAIKGMVGGGGITGGTEPKEGSVTDPAMMTSDEDAKDPVRMSEGHSWLERATKGAPKKGEAPDGGSITGGPRKPEGDSPMLAAIFRGVADAHPYDRDPEVSEGVAGAPRGYANGRGAPEADSVSWADPKSWGMNQKGVDIKSTAGQAPGADDWERYGEGAKKGDVVDWNNGGAIAKPNEKPGALQAILRGLSGAQPYGAQPRDVTTSDPKAKRAVYWVGREHGAQAARNGEDVPAIFPAVTDDEELVEVKPGQPEIRKKDGEQAPPSKSIDMRRYAPGAIRAITDGDVDNRALSSAAEYAARVATDVRARTPDSRVFPGLKTESLAPTKKAPNANASMMTSDEDAKRGFERVPDGDMAQAMRSMAPSVYEYKPDFAGQNGQKPGEVNVGPMADDMAKDPVARTAIVRDPQTGMLAIDKSKAEKVIMGSLASLQSQIDSIDHDVPRAPRAKKQRRRVDSAQP